MIDGFLPYIDESNSKLENHLFHHGYVADAPNTQELNNYNRGLVNKNVFSEHPTPVGNRSVPSIGLNEGGSPVKIISPHKLSIFRKKILLEILENLDKEHNDSDQLRQSGPPASNETDNDKILWEKYKSKLNNSKTLILYILKLYERKAKNKVYLAENILFSVDVSKKMITEQKNHWGTQMNK